MSQPNRFVTSSLLSYNFLNRKGQMGTHFMQPYHAFTTTYVTSPVIFSL